MPPREGFAPCPLQARTRPSPRATTGGERDTLILRPTIAILDAESLPPASRIVHFARPSTPRRPTLVFSPLASPAAAHSFTVCRPRTSPPHFLYPVFLTLGVFASDLVSLLFGHGKVAPHTLSGLFGLEGLVFPISSHTGHTFVVASTVKGFYVLDPVVGSILTFTIQLLISFVFFRVPLFSGGLAQSWRIHDPVVVIGQHTRLPTHATFGTDWEKSVCSGHDGSVAAGQYGHGVDDNNRGSQPVLVPNDQLGNGYRPVGSPRALAICSGVGGALGGLGGLSFFLAARCSCFRFEISSLCLRYHLCLASFTFSGSLLGISNHTDVWSRRWIISRVSSTNH